MNDWNFTIYYLLFFLTFGLILLGISYIIRKTDKNRSYKIPKIIALIGIIFSSILICIYLIDMNYADERREERLGEMEFGKTPE